MILFWAHAAFATSGFDPTTAAETFTGSEVWDEEETVQLWSRIERLEDPDDTLFGQGDFNSVTEWADNTAFAPWIGDCFGTSTPADNVFLLHRGIHAEWATGTPILFVPGAGDNGSRGFITMAAHMDIRGRPVFAITFAHPHGEVLGQAEIVADAIARVKELTGASQVDLVAHSKGGSAVAAYLSNYAGANWGDSAYGDVGTKYRGDVRKAVFIASPLGGIDTAYRWPLGNLSSTIANTALSPTSWATYYPYGSTAPAWQTDLSEQDFLPAGGDLFAGQRQLLARQDYDLPGSLSWMGVYSLQPDWYTTYEGGLGFESYSDGIDAAIAAGDHLVTRIADNGVDPAVELYVLAGENPIMPNGTGALWTEYFGQEWVDIATSGTDAWAALVADAIGDGLVDVGISEDEVQGLASGDLILGEISGPSDGLVFVSSATDTDALTGRGAVVKDTYVANLSHLDLLYASPITGNLLIKAGEADPLENGWMVAVGERYVEADTIGWVETALADPEGDTDTDADTDSDTDADSDTDTDTDSDTDADSGDTGDTGTPTGDTDPACSGCSSAGAAGFPEVLLALGALVRRRR